MRMGLWMGVSIIFISKMAAWSQPRYSLGWWTVELIQITAAVVAFLLIMRRMALLEGRVTELETRLSAIQKFVGHELTKAKARVLELVAQ